MAVTPADEGQQVNNVCPPPGTTVYKRYAIYRKDGTNDWFTRPLHPDTVAYLVGSCIQTAPPIPPFFPGASMPTPRPDHAKDYIRDDGQKRFFIATSVNQPSNPYLKIYVDRSD